MPWLPQLRDFANVFSLFFHRASHGHRGTCLAVTGDRTDKRLSRSELREDGPPGRITKSLVGESHMKNLFNRFVREEQGQDLIEYALLAGLISLASVLAITALGTAIQGKFTAVGSAVTAAGS
jgi:pilus assembly protein Flp/PilA